MRDDDCKGWLRWELRRLLGGARLVSHRPLESYGLERWQLELAVSRMVDISSASLEGLTLTPHLSIDEVVACLSAQRLRQVA